MYEPRFLTALLAICLACDVIAIPIPRNLVIEHHERLHMPPVRLPTPMEAPKHPKDGVNARNKYLSTSVSYTEFKSIWPPSLHSRGQMVDAIHIADIPSLPVLTGILNQVSGEINSKNRVLVEIINYLSALISGTTPPSVSIPQLYNSGSVFNLSDPNSLGIILTPIIQTLESISNTFQGMRNAIQMFSLNLVQKLSSSTPSLSSKFKRQQVTVTSQCDFTSVNAAVSNVVGSLQGFISSLNALNMVFDQIPGLSVLSGMLHNVQSTVGDLSESTQNSLSSVENLTTKFISICPNSQDPLTNLDEVLQDTFSALSNLYSGITNTLGTVSNATAPLSNASSAVGPSTIPQLSTFSGASNSSSAFGNATSSLTSATSVLNNATSTLGDATKAIGNLASSINNATTSLHNATSSLGNMTSNLTNVISTLGSATSTIGSVTNTLGGFASMGNSPSGMNNNSNPLGSIGNVASTLTSPPNAQSGLNNVTNLASGLGSLANQALTPGNVTDSLASLTAITGNLANVTSNLSNITSGLSNSTSLVSGLSNGVNPTNSLSNASSVLNSTSGYLGSGTTGTGNILTGLGGVVSAVPLVGPPVGGLVSGLGQTVSSVPLVGNIVGALTPNGTSNALGTVVHTAGGVTQPVAGLTSSAGNVLGTTNANTQSGFLGGTNAMASVPKVQRNEIV